MLTLIILLMIPGIAFAAIDTFTTWETTRKLVYNAFMALTCGTVPPALLLFLSIFM